MFATRRTEKKLLQEQSRRLECSVFSFLFSVFLFFFPFSFPVSCFSGYRTCIILAGWGGGAMSAGNPEGWAEIGTLTYSSKDLANGNNRMMVTKFSHFRLVGSFYF
jgi:hypothetical protein